MPIDDPKRPLEARIRDAATHMEEDLRRVVTYLNDEVIPDIRRNGSEALRTASAELHKLAERVDEANRRTPPPPPPPK